MRDDNPYRLSRSVEPVHYDLFLHIDPDQEVFSGYETIAVRVNEATALIELNAVDITVSLARVNGESASVTVDPAHEIVQIQRTAPLTAGTDAEIYLEFSARLRSDLSGLYSSVYNDEQGVSRKMATTQFESTGARQAFPCFDEPDMKATFAVTLETPAALEAISNYPEVASQPSDNSDFVTHMCAIS